MPTRATPSTSANSPHRISSCGVRGARCACCGAKLRRRQARAGRACRSASAATDPAPPAPTAPCTPAAPATAPHEAPSISRGQPRLRRSCRHHIADQPLVPTPPSARATTAACDTPGCRSSTASISPGSIRNPRSFTCASARPRNSSTPSPRHRARSPVRYIRSPAAHAAAMRVGDKPLRRQPRRGQITPRQTNARDVKLAHNTRRHRLQTTVQNINPIIRHRTADRDDASRFQSLGRRDARPRRSWSRSGRTDWSAARP